MKHTYQHALPSCNLFLMPQEKIACFLIAAMIISLHVAFVWNKLVEGNVKFCFLFIPISVGKAVDS